MSEETADVIVALSMVAFSMYAFGWSKGCVVGIAVVQLVYIKELLRR